MICLRCVNLFHNRDFNFCQKFFNFRCLRCVNDNKICDSINVDKTFSQRLINLFLFFQKIIKLFNAFFYIWRVNVATQKHDRKNAIATFSNRVKQWKKKLKSWYASTLNKIYVIVLKTKTITIFCFLKKSKISIASFEFWLIIIVMW